MSWSAVSRRVRSPSSAIVGMATVNGTPRSARRASDHRRETPGLGLLEELGLQAPQELGAFGHGPDVLLEDDLLGGRREDEAGQPAQMLGAPVRSPRVADVVPEQQRLQPEARGVEVVECVFAGAGEIAE